MNAWARLAAALLALDDALDVTERRLAGDRFSFRYQYAGLRLFVQDNGRLLLWPVHRSPRHGIFILHESGDLRVEYEPELLP